MSSYLHNSASLRLGNCSCVALTTAIHGGVLVSALKKLRALLILCTFSLPVFANDLAVMGQLAKDGAPNLALQLMDQSQPDPQKNISGWLFFEDQRLKIMNDWQQWSALIQRLSNVPDNAPASFKQFAGLQLANAYLQNNEASKALTVLQKLIWQPYAEYKEQDLLLYRRLVVRAYLLDKQLADARKSMLRYEQDYGHGSDQIKDEWRILKARVLLLDDRSPDALALLEDAHLSEGKALRFIAQLRTDPSRFKAVVSSARAELRGKDLSAVDQLRFWLVVAEAAQYFEKGLTKVKALEQAALLETDLPAEENIFSFNADKLWKAYRDYGYADGNAEQLLVGDDASWLAKAQAAQSLHPAKARALYSVVIAKSYDADNRTLAYTAFADSFKEAAKGDVILSLLFTQSNDYADVEAMPEVVRYRLINLALSQGSIKRAAYLMEGMEQAPEGVDDYQWNLRRARVLILNGQAQRGADLLRLAIQRSAALDAEAVDRAAQVVFDLQSVNADKLALPILNELLRRPVEPKLQRELLFWAADSFKAENQTAKAAAYYLRSATLLDGFGFDPWGQTARFNAAEVLEQGGIYDDAERLLKQLLKVTQDKKRQAVIRNQLQSIQLKRNAQQ